MTGSACTSDETMTVSAARMLRNGAVCFVGIGLPSTAANLARLLHAPDAVLIYESGPIGAKPSVLPLSIGDGILAETADTVVSTPEIFRYWLQGGRVDVGFLGAAQLDRFANINTTVIGDYRNPEVRLPGAGGAPEISSSAKEVLVIVKQSRRSFVERLDFVTSAGFLTGGDARRRAGIAGNGPAAVITDLCILRPEAETHELIVTSIHRGISREQICANTGWEVRFSQDCGETEPPTQHELEVLRDLLARTAAAHGTAENAA
jgi:glutaconate CoA-transferase, subunit B